MKKIIYSSLLLFCFSLLAKGQLSEGGQPLSFTQPKLKSATDISTNTLRKLNIDRYLEEDKELKLKNRYAISRNVSIDIKKKGSLIEMDNGKLWKYQIVSKNAFSIGLVFDSYYLPEGAKLFIYNSEKGIVKGAFTARNNKSYKRLAIADVFAPSLIIEYYEPNGVAFEGELKLGQISQAYRNLNTTEADQPGDINCPQGDNAQLIKHAVAKMTYSANGASFLCTGALINNTKNDGKPYFLTARHCLSRTSEAQTLVTHFNLENLDCGTNFQAAQTLSGSALIANHEDSDFTLLELDENPPANYYPYFAGWNAEATVSVNSAVSIHHPDGDVKKIAIDYDEVFNYPFGINWGELGSVSPENTHWLVTFNQGSTEGGSSGAPLFDENNRIIGQLHGGDERSDFYGKFSHSWDQVPIPLSRLNQYLDPANTGKKVLDGHFPSSNPIEAQFKADFTTVCKEGKVSLKDISNFKAATSWTWGITPASHTFVDGTNANSKNPVVTFQEDKAYNITLLVSDGTNSSTRSRQSYISASGNIKPTVKFADSLLFYQCLYDTITLKASNAESYEWMITEGSEYIIIDSTTLKTDSLFFVKNEMVTVDSNYTLTVKLVGFHGSCSDTITRSIIVYYPSNDNIEDAIALEYGLNGVFANVCATVQDKEPTPAQGDCNTQGTWCTCETSDTVIDNSVWFTFTAPASGIVGVYAPGFDNQMAIYEADKTSDLLSGDSRLFKIVAANDDYFGEENNFASLIEQAVVTPNKKYWLQVDGSGCGAFGTFLLLLADSSLEGLTSIENIAEESTGIQVFPNPATEVLNFSNLPNEGDISVLSVDGRIIDTRKISAPEMQIAISNSRYQSGIYLILIKTKEATLVKKVSVRKE